MTTKAIPPLKKRKVDKAPYSRPAAIEEKLLEISRLSRSEIASRCQIHDEKEVDYIPSECLVHLVRQNRSQSMDECSEALFRALLERVIGGLPTGESLVGNRVDATKSEIGDRAREKFLTMLMEDRTDYVEGLDIFEARFAMGLSTLRIDAERKVWRMEKPSKREDFEDPDTGKLSRKVEVASGFDPYERHKLDDPEYVLRLYKAIDDLPCIKKAIIEMDRNGFVTESTDPAKATISTELGHAPKTIRAYRELAHSALRAALTKGEPQ